MFYGSRHFFSVPSGSVPKDAESDDILKHYSSEEAAELREEAAALNCSVNFLVSQFAKVGYKTMMDAFVKNEPIPGFEYTPQQA